MSALAPNKLKAPGQGTLRAGEIMYKHFQIQTEVKVKDGNTTNWSSIVSVETNGLNLKLKIQKGRVCINDFYYLICDLIKRGEFQEALEWVPKYQKRGAIVHQGFSGAEDHFITFQDETGFVHKKFVIHSTMSGFIENQRVNEYLNEFTLFVPDVITMMLECKFQHICNDDICLAILGRDKSNAYNWDDANRNVHTEVWEIFPSRLAEESDVTAYTNLKEYAKLLMDGPEQSTEAIEEAGE